MHTIEDVKELLIRHEGFRLKPYRCTAGKLTIGKVTISLTATLKYG
jgi:GH24 family phage-related lysozyme (muramidase)